MRQSAGKTLEPTGALYDRVVKRVAEIEVLINTELYQRLDQLKEDSIRSAEEDDPLFKVEKEASNGEA